MRQLTGAKTERANRQVECAVLPAGSVLLALRAACTLLAALIAAPAGAADSSLVTAQGDTFTLVAGHPSLKRWLMPREIPAPADNATTPERIKLGEMLFFDARLSVHGYTSCAMCHLPERGFADGVPTSVRFMGEKMTRNSPGLVNVAYNPLHMWDGRNATLEQQALSSQSSLGSLNAGAHQLGITEADLGMERIRRNVAYARAFAKAYPDEPITKQTAAKAISAFERSLVSRDSPFDRWVQGDVHAMTARQVNGFRIFLDPSKGNCVACHAAPNFTDNGFHNLGLRQFGQPDPDVGRFSQRAIPSMRGAFRTPTLRDVDLTPPYFHDGSANTLWDVVEHYARGGDARANLSPLIRPLAITAEEKADLVSFMKALTTRRDVYATPRLPR
ncbi:cytochrome c peroxidase [Piscinibacter sp. XHJ-5]|uniref:cytochrome-c peroxidase n=1 Tax=Piscinibacter sp. XHJ-5 TaxID=3037797 RepID=UPI0024533ACD|nr:cytochrome c peroxidase [Piscinibacter sp. XHJ-5]